MEEGQEEPHQKLEAPEISHVRARRLLPRTWRGGGAGWGEEGGGGRSISAWDTRVKLAAMVEDGGRRGWLPGWSCPFSSTTSSVQVHLGLGYEGGGEGGRGGGDGGHLDAPHYILLI